MPWLAAIPAVVGAISSADESRKGRTAANNAAQEALGQYSNIYTPDVEEQKLVLQQLASSGQLTPEMLQSLSLGPSAQQGVTADQGDVSAQKGALDQLQQVSSQGLTAADAAASRDVSRQVGNADQARRKSVLDSMAQRGTLGSGAELAAQLDNVNKSQDAQAAANDKMLQQIQANRLSAIAQTGQLSGQMRTQDFGEKSQRAQAADAINKFNLQNKQNVMNTNVSNQNDAAKLNLANNQRIADTNVGIANSQQANNKGLLQSQFNNQLQLANAKANRNQQVGQTAQAGANAVATGIAGIGSGLTNIFGSYGNSNNKTNTTPSNTTDEEEIE